jgi:cytochrome P450
MATAEARPPVEDWATDYDIFDPQYYTDPAPIWADLRQRCPVAHTERWGGSWIATRYEDVAEMARMVPELSNEEFTVVPPVPLIDPVTGEVLRAKPVAPPISSDPPFHGVARRLLLQAFSPQAVARFESYTEDLANRLIDEFIDKGRCDAAVQYAQQIPPKVISHLMGLDETMGDTFIEWVRGVLEIGATNPEVRAATGLKMYRFWSQEIERRRAEPTGDFINWLMEQDLDGEPMDDEHVRTTCGLLLVAGIDTTWSSIGAALWHLANHADDRERLVREPELLPTAVEEFLRVYSPVTMARLATEDVTVNGVTIPSGSRVLMNFPAANRDPEVFPEPDTVVLDRAQNRHVAFGIGIHRCAGSNLARMEMQVALSVFLERIPEFHLDDSAPVTWCGGQVRGPRSIPLVFTTD